MSENQNTIKGKVKRKLRHPILFLTLVVAMVFAVCAERFIAYQVNRFEQGLIDVCATQQDAYVQLVLDQINLKDNRNDEEIVLNILGTIDASSNKYWTFSRDEAMLFVKDVLETNKYKGFTTATYYVSDSAQSFLNTLQLDRVTHKEIEIGEKRYIASGVIFIYRGEEYRLCLLTNRDVLLDNNTFLGAKVNLLTTVAVMLFLLVIVPLVFARHMRKMLYEADEREESISELNRRLEHLNKRFSEQDLHDTRYNLWRRDSIGGFLNKLEGRGVEPIGVLEILCADAGERERFLSQAHFSLDKQVLRFEFGAHNLLLIFVQTGEDAMMLSVIPLLSEKTQIGRKYLSDAEHSFNAESVRQKFGIEE